jgi:hypothetical protein
LITRTTTTARSRHGDGRWTEALLEARRHHRCSLLESIRPAIEALLH